MNQRAVGIEVVIGIAIGVLGQDLRSAAIVHQDYARIVGVDHGNLKGAHIEDKILATVVFVFLRAIFVAEHHAHFGHLGGFGIR